MMFFFTLFFFILFTFFPFFSIICFKIVFKNDIDTTIKNWRKNESFIYPIYGSYKYFFQNREQLFLLFNISYGPNLLKSRNSSFYFFLLFQEKTEPSKQTVPDNRSFVKGPKQLGWIETGLGEQLLTNCIRASKKQNSLQLACGFQILLKYTQKAWSASVTTWTSFAVLQWSCSWDPMKKSTRPSSQRPFLYYLTTASLQRLLMSNSTRQSCPS